MGRGGERRGECERDIRCVSDGISQLTLHNRFPPITWTQIHGISLKLVTRLN